MGPLSRNSPLGAASQAYHFPRTKSNHQRIVVGVIVTEAAIDSGSLITAQIGRRPGARGLCGSRLRERRHQPRYATP